MVTSRRGAGKLGCLFSTLLAVTVIYFGVNIGEVYWRYFEFRDAMTQEVRFSATRSDDASRLRLASLADSLGLPPEAGRVIVRRGSSGVTISTDYTENVELPMFVRAFRFRHQAGGGS